MRAWAVAMFAMLPAAHVVAQQPLTEATPAELIEKLQPVPAFTRSLRNLKPEPRSVDLAIQFDFDSAALSPSSHALLGNLAQAMNTDQMATMRFRIEGHTDAKGSERYNQWLSVRRAQAVRTHLVAKGVDRNRLMPEGRGARDLLYPDAPYDAANRRVRVVAMSGGQP